MKIDTKAQTEIQTLLVVHHEKIMIGEGILTTANLEYIRSLGLKIFYNNSYEKNI